MFTSPIRIAILPLALLVPFGAFAARGMLKADGIIRVKGADLHSAMVTVVPGRAASYGLQVSSKNITLDLPLDDVYLVSVQRTGCPTKEVYFDARVPAEMHGTEFQFPFQVTLESLPPERMFAYDGPVGFVRYVHALKDFGYETKYVVRVEEDLKSRMKEMQQTGVDPKMIAPTMQASVIDRARRDASSTLGTKEDISGGTVAPLVNRTPQLVHVVSAPPTTMADPDIPGVERTTSASELSAAASPSLAEGAVVPKAEPAPTAPMLKAVPSSSALVRGSTGDARDLNTSTTLVGMEPRRSEEFITETRRVTRIVRFTEPTGKVEEYRMVAHAFGAVYYFHDSRPITERDFVQAIE